MGRMGRNPHLMSYLVTLPGLRAIRQDQRKHTRIQNAETMMIAEKVKFQLEIPLNSSKGVLYNCISTPSGLAEWFCDDVNIKKDVHIFFWDGSEESARMISKKKDEFVKFRWLEAEEEGEDTYFELRIRVDDLTGENSLLVTDFADDDEVEDAEDLWHAQVDKLRRVLGC